MTNGLIILGSVILVGFIGNVLYKKTKVPESLFLMILGILLGPVFGVIDGKFLLDNATFLLNLALVVVLLNSGLSIDVMKTVKNTPLAFLFTILVLIITTTIITLVTTIFFGWPVINGIFLGVLGFGTEMITITHLIEKLKIGENTKTILLMESVLNDIILITVISILLTIVTRSAETPLLRVILDKFALSAVLGIVFAIIWIFLFFKYIHGNELGYVFTLGAAFLIYDGMEYFGFNGAIAVLVFSVSLGNFKYILGLFKEGQKLVPLGEDIVEVEGVNNQITFIVRTLFFVFIGLIFNLSLLRREIIFFVLLITAVLVAARYLSARVLAFIKPEFKNSVPIITAMAASGFIDTLLAIVVSRAGVNIPNLTEIILLIVMFTTVVSLVAAILLEKKYAGQVTY